MSRLKQVSFLAIVMALLLVFMVPHLTAGVKPATDVNVVNPVILNSDVDNPARQPFTKQFDIFMKNGESFGDTLPFQVPPGKRLVIEFVSVSFQLPTGQGPTATFAFIEIPLAKGLYSVFNIDVFVGNQLMRLYVEPGDYISGSIARSANGNLATEGSAVCTFIVSGYYVNLN